MPLTLVVVSPPAGPFFAVRSDARLLVLGRGDDAHVRLPDPSVSARHACLKRRGQHYLVSDEGSTNGTAVLSHGSHEPVYLAPGSPRIVHDGDRLRLGYVELALFVNAVPAGALPGELIEVDELKQLPERLVQSALELRGLSPTEQDLALALRELWGAADERLGGAAPQATPSPAPTAPLEDPKNNPRLTDAVVGVSALLVLGLGLYALSWLLR